MPLRTRMFVAFAVIAGTLGAAGILLLTLQRNYLIDQIDTRLGRQLSNAVTLATGGTTAGGVAPRGARGLADMYVGILTDAGLTTVATPATDQGLVPVLPTNEVPQKTPTTVAAEAGESTHIRIVTTPLSAGGTLILGRSLLDVDAAMADLRTTMVAVGLVLIAVLALVLWWVRRLGLDPILRVTKVAQAIRTGDTSQRVEPFPAGTEAQELGSAFNQLVEDAEATNARLRQFVADASHELRTPLVTLKGYAALHGAGGLADQAAMDDAMRRIKQEANRMGRLVDDLLLLTESDQGLAATREQVDLVPILRDLLGDLRVLDPLRDIALSAPESALVAGDRDRLAQVFAGLTSNALRHTPPGTAIELRITTTSSAVRVEVADQGPGISPADLPRVFDRFYRADAARARASGGSGLGLAIAAAIVRAHQGTIGVESPPGHGATFWVELPLHPRTPV